MKSTDYHLPNIKLTDYEWLNYFAKYSMYECISQAHSNHLWRATYDIIYKHRDDFDEVDLANFARHIRFAISEKIHKQYPNIFVIRDSINAIEDDAATLLVQYLIDTNREIGKCIFYIDCEKSLVKSTPVPYLNYPESIDLHEFQGWIKLANYIDKQEDKIFHTIEDGKTTIKCVKYPVYDKAENKYFFRYSPIDNIYHYIEDFNMVLDV